MPEIIIFVVGSALILWISIPSLRRPGSHGFYRFFAWEIILGLFVTNLRVWFVHAFAWYQIISWVLLIASLVPIISGVILLRTVGKPTDELEATTHLVTVGIYRFIRHPLYASLLSLAWGIFFKSPSLPGGCMVVVATAFLYATARADEAECLVKFGEAYERYSQRTRRFIPWIF
ncbi:MAG TPA: isoprenylcysteine carboxylmethyltransferase family protein [Anaerolineales bacterium]|nr:isoprenylcysteine carboxylmethyltransferase family protein [Anaerolineales bacterium]